MRPAPFISLRRALRSALLFIAGPSEPRSPIIITYILSDLSPPFQLAAAREENRGEGGKVAAEGPRAFASGEKLPASPAARG